MKLVEEITQTEQNLKKTVESNECNYGKKLLGKPTIPTSNDESKFKKREFYNK